MSRVFCFVLLCYIYTGQAIRIEPGLSAYHSAPVAYDDGYGDYHQPALRVAVLKKVPLRQKDKEQQQDFSKIPGVPGHDYPLYHEVPETSFSCEHVPHRPGMYANVETGCQAYHVCHDGREGKQGSKFLCTNGTLFNQEKFTCDWWYNVDCKNAVNHYNLNLDPLKNPYYQKPKTEKPEVHVIDAGHEYHAGHRVAAAVPVYQYQHQPEYEDYH